MRTKTLLTVLFLRLDNCYQFSLDTFNLLHTQLTIFHNAVYLPPQILHNLCFSLPSSQEKLKIILMPNFIGGQIRCIMGDVQVAYNAS